MKERIRQMLKKDRLSLSLSLIIVSAIIVESISVVQYYYVRDLLKAQLEERAERQLISKMRIVDNVLNSAEATLPEHLPDIRAHIKNPDDMYRVTRRLIMFNKNIVGGCIAFVPNYYKEKGRLFETYAYKKGGEVLVEQIAHVGHDYTKNPVFQEVIRTGKDFWSAPYEYEEDSISCLTTYTYPVYDKENKLAAVVGLDVNVSFLNDILNRKFNNPSSFGLILTGDGQLIVDSSSKPSEESVASAVVRLINDSTVKRVPSLDGRCWSKEFYDEEKGESANVHFMSMQENPYWQIAVVSYESEAFATLHKLRRYHMILMLVGLLVMFFIIDRFAKNSKRLQEANIEQARIGSELRIAQEIQMEMLPKTFPPFPDRDDIDIYGSLEPAKEVGGDIFEFFIRNEKLFFCIGDVSGKGVPSAMVMSVMHTLFRQTSHREDNPARIMQTLNDELCYNNDTNMFVTFFIGVIDLPTGRIHYCNAGHDNPILVGEKVDKLPVKANLPLGVFTDVAYAQEVGVIPSDTTIFLYTDGLTEAKNANRQQFTRKRVMEVLGRITSGQDVTAKQLVKAVSREVYEFMGDAPQSDDLTLLAIRYNQQRGMYTLSDTIVLKNKVEQVEELSPFVKRLFEQLGIEQKLARKLQLAVEEAVVNVISYAYPVDETGDVRVDVMADESSVQFVITDYGIPFNPTVPRFVDTTHSAEERSVGGLGIFLIKEIMDTINYERIDGKNVLTLMKEYKDS